MSKPWASYESIDSDWLVYLGIGILGLSLVYLLFFVSKWPYPAHPFLAMTLSLFIGGWFIVYGHKFKGREIHTRKTYLLAGLGAYILWYALYVRATIYDNAGTAYHTGLAILLIVSLIFVVYSFALKGNEFLWTRED